VFSLETLQQTLSALGSTVWITLMLTLGAGIVSLIAGSISVSAQLGGGWVGLFASRAYVSLMRGTPLLVQLLVLSYGLPLLGIRVPPILAAILAIGLNSGAYATEILRGGVLSIAPGQIEAAKMVGLSRFAIWRRIVLPQAMASSLPMLVAEFSIILKSTPLASIISVTEMTYAGVLIQARSFSSLDVFLPIAAAYVAIFYAFTMLAAWLDRQLAPMRG